MRNDRRHFLRMLGVTGAGWALGWASGQMLRPAMAQSALQRIAGAEVGSPADAMSVRTTARPRRWSRGHRPFLTLLHTNDTHARHDPFPSASFRHAGDGGVLRRARLIDLIRSEGSPVLLLDAGDVFQGTPWFDAFDGELEMRMMSALGYDAIAVGNHEFDLGIDGFAAAVQGTDLPIVCANYDFGSTAMAPFVQPFLLRDIPGGIRVGIFGVGIPLEGNVLPDRHHGVISLDPVAQAKATAAHLRQVMRCDLVIALSHLGYAYGDDRPQDLTLAARVEGIDLIIGGHTHTFLDEPTLVTEPSGRRIPVFQAGHSGLRLGRIDLFHRDPRLAGSEGAAPAAANDGFGNSAPSAFPLKTASGDLVWLSAVSLPIDASLDA